MSRIFARSPFIVEVNQLLQSGSKIEIFLWNGNGAAPILPQYTLSKLIPASNNLQTLYNVSPYIREYIKFVNFSNNFNVDAQLAQNLQWCNVKIKTYKLFGASYILVTTTTYQAFDGFSYYTDGYNYDLGPYLLEQKNYNYLYDPNTIYGTNLQQTAGSLVIYGTSGHQIKYTDLGTGAVHIYTLPVTRVYELYRVFPAFIANGNLLEYKIGLATNASWTFRPIEECRYTPLTIDFVNAYGGWQREFLFKASNETISIENTEYNLLQNTLVNYDVTEGQRKVFNANGKTIIKGNTGFVDENFKSNLKQLMLSERILVNNQPAKINTKATELFKNINTKQINYTLEFEIANDIINNVV